MSLENKSGYRDLSTQMNNKTPFTRDRIGMVTISSLKTSMTLKFAIILQNLIKAYHRKKGKSKHDRELTELDVETEISTCVFHLCH